LHANTQNSLVPNGDLVLRRLSHDHILAAQGAVGSPGARIVHLLANHEEIAEVPVTLKEEAMARFEHASENAFRVAGSAPVEEAVVLTERDKGRHRVHVSAKDHRWALRPGDEISSAGAHLLALNI